MGAEKAEKTMDVGVRLRELRTERGLSMRALARLSGLSTNALSMIERGKTSPSVSTLYKLSEALEVPITAFFRTEPPREAIVYRKADRRSRVEFQRGLWEGLGGESFVGRVEPFMLTLEGGATSGPHSLVHSGHEFVICLKGQLEYEVEGQRYSLQPGDSLLFASKLHHRWRNPGKTVANVLFVLSGFALDERPSEFHLSYGQQEMEDPTEG
ncbi:MAG TPA: helix-turn-helix domain-containing protein [Anaerolineales bacterium]|jgi:transcriptional regulator with XRE-family HTH domain|nr:helix-turn-helix domain-containing protein [Anaerolineales bacterium]